MYYAGRELSWLHASSRLFSWILSIVLGQDDLAVMVEGTDGQYL